MDRLKNKRALIRGRVRYRFGNSETVPWRRRPGCRDRPNTASLESAQKELGSRALLIASDAGNVEAQSELARAIGKAFGKLDIRIVNAGIADMRPLEKWDEGGFDRSFDIKVKARFSCAGIVANFSNPASIVLTTSINAYIGAPTSSVYGASKAALLSTEGTLSCELISRGIRVNAVSPSPIATPLYDKLGLAPADLKAMSESVKTQIPAARFGSPEEIANTIVFLASDEAACTVGSELVIDGGMSHL